MHHTMERQSLMTAVKSKLQLNDSDLNVPFIEKKQLAENATPFLIISYDERTSMYQNKQRQESVFTVALVEGPDAGYEQLLTLGVTAPRQRLGALIKRTGMRGPVRLEERSHNTKGEAYANPTYVFVPVEDPKVIAATEKLVAQGLDTSDDSGE